MEDESDVTRSIIYEVHSSYIQNDLLQGESDVTSSIIDELHCFDMQ